MKKRIILPFVLIWVQVLFAGVISIGKIRDGHPLVIPLPQRFSTVAGNFRLPDSLAVNAPEDLDLSPLETVYAQTVPNGMVVRAEEAPVNFVLTGIEVPESSEGYTLMVTPQGVEVRSQALHGLYNGMQTLGWLLRNRTEPGSLSCCAITDWPDLQMRGLFLQLNKCWHAPLFDMDRVCHVIDVLGTLKYNTLVVEFADNFPFEESLFSKRKATYSRQDIEKFLAAAKRNHIEVIPYFPLVKGYAMENHADWEEMREMGGGGYCLSNPKIQPLIEKCIRETADFIKPRYFHITLDEIELIGFPACPKCKAAGPEQLLLNHLLPIKKILEERGITPIVYQDQFFGCAEPSLQRGLGIRGVLDALGHDTVINSWEYWCHPSDAIGREIRNAGFNNLLYMSFAIDLENSWRLPVLASKMNAMGNILTYWQKVPATLDWSATYAMPAFYPSTIAQGNYCWNAHDVDFCQIPMDGAVLLRELLDGALPNAFQGTASPLPLAGTVNTALSGDPVLPELDDATVAELQRIAAADPAHFNLVVNDGTLLATILSGTPYDGYPAGPVTIPVNTTATGASFLMTAAAFNTFTYPTSVYELKFIDIGALKFVYADGTEEELPLRYRRNINDWNSSIGTNCCRIVARGNDRNGDLFTLCAIDWRNQFPEKELREIIFSTKGDTFLSPVLFAASLSDTGKAPTGLNGTPSAPPPVKRTPVTLRDMVSFQNGIPDNTNAQGFNIKKFISRTADDPQRGKVLELRLPEGCPYLSRVVADIPLEGLDEFDSVVFDIKLDTPQAVFRPDFYLGNRNLSKYLNATGFYLDVDDQWHTVCIPLSRFGKANGGIDPKEAKLLRFGFFMQEWAGPVSIRISDVRYCDGVMPCRINITRPVK